MVTRRCDSFLFISCCFFLLLRYCYCLVSDGVLKFREGSKEPWIMLLLQYFSLGVRIEILIPSTREEMRVDFPYSS